MSKQRVDKITIAPYEDDYIAELIREYIYENHLQSWEDLISFSYTIEVEALIDD